MPQETRQTKWVAASLSVCKRCYVSWLGAYKAKRAAGQVERKAKADARRAMETARKARVDRIADLLLTGSFVHALQTQGELPAYAGSLEEALGRRGIKPEGHGNLRSPVRSARS